MLDAASDRLSLAQQEERAATKQAVIDTMEQEFVALALSQDAVQVSAPEGNVEAEEVDVLCVVCMSERKEVLFSPCLQSLVGQWCWWTVQSQRSSHAIPSRLYSCE